MLSYFVLLFFFHDKLCPYKKGNDLTLLFEKDNFRLSTCLQNKYLSFLGYYFLFVCFFHTNPVLNTFLIHWCNDLYYLDENRLVLQISYKNYRKDLYQWDLFYIVLLYGFFCKGFSNIFIHISIYYVSLYRGTIYSILQKLYLKYKPQVEDFIGIVGRSVRKYELQKYLRN